MFKYRTIFLIIFSLVNLLFVVASQLVTIITIGPSNQTDALFAGMVIPTIILTIVSSSLTNVLVPIFINSSDAKKTLWEHIFIMFLGGGALIAPLIVSSSFWIRWIFPGFDNLTLELTSQILQLQLLAIPFSLCSTVYSSYLNSQSNFLSAEFIPALCSLCIFPAVFYAIPHYGVLATSYLYFAKVIITSILQSCMFGRPNIPSFTKAKFKETFCQMRPLLIGSLYYKSGPIIDRNILSHSVSGTMSIFVLGQQLLSMANLVLTKSLIIPQITVMNKVAIEDRTLLKDWVKKKVFWCLGISMGLFLLYCLIGLPLLRLVFEFFDYKKLDYSYLWVIVACLFGTFIGDYTATLVSSAFYSLNDTRTPSYISMFTFTIFIPLKYIGFYYFNAYGLAVVCSVYSILNLIMLFYVLYQVKLK
nr:lipid II flippase MurJ [uncultured Enterobacter sp.]